MNNRKESVKDVFGLYETPKRFIASGGDVLDGYEVINILGEGTFGIVYKVRAEDNQVLALKMVKLWEIAYEKERKAIISRFTREFEIAVIDAQHLVKSHKYGKLHGNPYITMDYCEGGSLGEWTGKFASHKNFEKITCQVLLGLHELHTSGYFHRDIKPQNILLTAKGEAKLTDFGIAGQKNNRLTVTNIFGKVEQIFGTWAYLAPEQSNNRIAFKALDAVTDIFSFGVMMFELFTGEFPFPPGKINSESDLVEYLGHVKKGNWQNLYARQHELPGPWAEIIMKCLEPDYAKKRFRNVKAILDILGYSDIATSEPENIPGAELALQITYGDEQNKIFNLPRLLAGKQAGSVLTIGRKDPSVRNDIGIVEMLTTYISRRHATIEKWNDPECWIIRDGQWTPDGWKASVNGLYINSQAAGMEGTVLKPGDIITLGDTTLKVINAGNGETKTGL